MIRSLFVISCIALGLSGCEIISGLEPHADAEDLQILSDSTEYVGRRSDPKTVSLRLELTYINRSKSKIYLYGCGYPSFQLERLVDGIWEIRGGPKSCDLLKRDSEVVLAGERRVFEVREGSSDRTGGWNWGREDISGTYRVAVGAYLKFDYDRQEWNKLVPETGLYSNTFEVEDRCVISWGGC